MTAEQVVKEFPWYTDLHGLCKAIPSYSAKVVVSTPGTARGAQLLALVQKSAPQAQPLQDMDSHPCAAPSSLPTQLPTTSSSLITQPPASEAAPAPQSCPTFQELPLIDKGKSHTIDDGIDIDMADGESI